MPATLLFTLFLGYATAARDTVRARTRAATASGDEGSVLEAVIVILGLIALAVAFVAVMTLAVNRRLDQIT